MNDKEMEQQIVAKGLTAPRVTLDNLNQVIKDIEIVKFVTKGNKVLRWAVLTMKNGFAVVGNPSASVSPENDDAEIGERIAIENSKNKVWELEGYALASKLHTQGE